MQPLNDSQMTQPRMLDNSLQLEDFNRLLWDGCFTANLKLGAPST